MLTINKKIRITSDNTKVEFDLQNQLPEGEYEVQLVINDKTQENENNYNLETWWKNGVKLDKFYSFRREDLYSDDGR